MKQVQCLRTCYASLVNSEKLRLHVAEEIREVEDDFELPKELKDKFFVLGSDDNEELEELGFGVATREVLMDNPLRFDPLKDFAKKVYGYDLVKADKKKEAIVDEFLHAREEFILSASNPNQSN